MMWTCVSAPLFGNLGGLSAYPMPTRRFVDAPALTDPKMVLKIQESVELGFPNPNPPPPPSVASPPLCVAAGTVRRAPASPSTFSLPSPPLSRSCRPPRRRSTSPVGPARYSLPAHPSRRRRQRPSGEARAAPAAVACLFPCREWVETGLLSLAAVLFVPASVRRAAGVHGCGSVAVGGRESLYPACGRPVAGVRPATSFGPDLGSSGPHLG